MDKYYAALVDYSNLGIHAEIDVSPYTSRSEAEQFMSRDFLAMRTGLAQISLKRLRSQAANDAQVAHFCELAKELEDSTFVVYSHELPPSESGRDYLLKALKSVKRFEGAIQKWDSYP